MIFRYDFGSALDLTRFKKQSIHYIGKIPVINYHLFLKDYKIVADINTTSDSTTHNVTISIFDIVRDPDGEILDSNVIVPLNDVRFKELKDVINVFPNDYCKADFNSSSTENTSDKICKIIRILYKINNLKAFL
jgi:hypothetical protein